MIDDDLGTSFRQIGRLLGNIDLMARKIVEEEIAYKSYIHQKCTIISDVEKVKRMGCRANMKHAWDTSWWPLSYTDLNLFDCFV